MGRAKIQSHVDDQTPVPEASNGVASARSEHGLGEVRLGKGKGESERKGLGKA